MDTEIHRERSELLLIVGGGGHALVVAEAATALGWRLVGFLDDSPEPALAAGSGATSHLGGLRDLERVMMERAAAEVVLAIGHAATRRSLLSRLRACDAAHRAATVVHPTATISPTARIGRGVFVGPRAVVHTRAIIGDHAIVNTGAIIEHECEVGENAHIAPGAVLGGRAVVEADALVGIGARVMLNIRIGSGATVGCGAVVVKSVASGRVVKGVPAR